MIDTEELRQRAQEAHFGHMPLEISGSEVLELLDRIEAAEGDRATFIKEIGNLCTKVEALRANITEMEKQTPIGWLLVRLEAAEKECDALRTDKATLQQMTYSLKDRLEVAEKERDALRAKIAAMEKQEPHSYIYRYWDPLNGSPVWRHESGNWNGQQPGACAPLYALPGAKGE